MQVLTIYERSWPSLPYDRQVSVCSRFFRKARLGQLVLQLFQRQRNTSGSVESQKEIISAENDRIMEE